MNFTAFDFETSSGKTACALGVVRVENRVIVESKYWLIRPPDMYFNSYNIEVHGITPRDVINKPEFDELWAEMKPFFDNQVIVAHNAAFDISVLTNMLKYYDIDFPESEYYCTVMLGRKHWTRLTSHKLNILAQELGLRFKHHDALEDAVVCAKVAVEIIGQSPESELNEIAKRFGYKAGRLSAPDHLDKFKKLPKRKPVKASITKADKELITVKTNILEKLNFAIGGVFKNFEKNDLLVSIIENGGNITATVSKRTNYLLVGDKITKTKIDKANEYKIPVIKEQDYLKIIAGK